MKLKKGLLIGLSFVLVAAVAFGATLAYLTSTDSDVNVMTTGNVEIAQYEYERVVDADGNYTTIDVDGVTSYELKEFTQGKPLLPFVGSVTNGYDSTPVRLAQLGHNSRGGMDVLPAANIQDKFVVVENTGKTDAYVRTIVAFEAGSVVEEDWYKLVKYTSHFTWEETEDWFVTEIDGNNYYLVEFVYNGYENIQHPNGVLTPGDYTYNSLAQVYLFDTATNEDCEALDGNKNGTFDILVMSQAVQTAGFDNAKTALDAGFGEFNAENAAEWFGGIELPVGEIITNSDDLADAIASGEDAVITYTGSEDFVIDEESTISGDVTLNFFDTDAALVVEEKLNVTGNLTITNATVDADVAGEIAVDGGSLTLGKGAVLSVDGEMPNAGVIRVIDDSEIVLDGAEIKGCDNNGKGVLINVAAGAKMTIEDGTVISGNVMAGSGNTPYALIKVCGELVMNGGEIVNNEFAHKALISIEGGKFVMNGGLISNNTYTGTSSTSIFYFFTGNAKFEMNGGTIAGNDLGSNSSSAVFNTYSSKNPGTLVVNGGTVQNNIAGNRDSFAYINGLTSISIDSAANVSGIVNDSWGVGQKDVNDIKK